MQYIRKVACLGKVKKYISGSLPTNRSKKALFLQTGARQAVYKRSNGFPVIQRIETTRLTCYLPILIKPEQELRRMNPGR